MPTPHNSILLAAVRWLEALPFNSPERCLVLFTNSAKYSDLRSSQYYAARQWLVHHGLFLAAQVAGGPNARIKVFEAAISETVWFPEADQIITTPKELPLDAAEAADACDLTDDEAFAVIRQRHALVDSANRKRIGNIGELRLVDLLRSHTSCEVEHLAAQSDGYGYDLLVTGTIVLHIEVKTTTRANQNVMYLSRHEYDTMLQDPLWQLVFLKLNKEFEIEYISTVNAKWIHNSAPNDSDPSVVAWQSIRMDIPGQHLTRGVDRINLAVREATSRGSRILLGR